MTFSEALAWAREHRASWSFEVIPRGSIFQVRVEADARSASSTFVEPTDWAIAFVKAVERLSTSARSSQPTLREPLTAREVLEACRGREGVY